MTVAKLSSFTAAANELHLTQSTLTTQIKQLEAHIGLELFNRTTRSVTTTDAGLSFLPVAEKLLSDFQTAIDDVSAQAQVKHGEVTLASSPSMLSSVLPSVVKSFRDNNPNIRFVMREESAGNIEKSVRQGEVDFGLGGNHSNQADLTYTPLLTDQYGVVSLDHQGQNDWQDLLDQKMIWLSSDTGIRAELERVLSNQKASLSLRDIELEVSSPSALAAMVSVGLGSSIIPALAASTPAFAQLNFKLLSKPKLVRTLYLIQRTGRTLSPASQRFIANLKPKLATTALMKGIEICLERD